MAGNGYGSSCGVGTAGVGGNGGGGNSGIGRDCSLANGYNGTDGLGGGGGSATYPPSTQYGGSGGSGIVILRYTTADIASYTTTGTTPTADTTTISGQTILSFTTVGTGTITFTTPIPPIPPFSGTRVTNPVTGFESPVDIGLKLPSGTNDNLPTAIQGMIRNDTSETTGSSASAIMHYNGADWKYFAATESADNPNLIMYLNASDTTSYPGTGTTWFDLTSNGYDGTISNSTWNPTGYFPFNGSSSIVRSTALGAAFSSQTTLSIAGWFQTSASTARMTIASFSNTLVGSTDLWIGLYASENTIAFRNSVEGASGLLQVNDTGGSNLRDGNWHHVVFTADSNGTHVYVDGSELSGYAYTFGASSTNIQMPSINQFSIGANQDSSASGGQWFLNGNISKVNVYNTALTSTEVNTLFLEGKGF